MHGDLLEHPSIPRILSTQEPQGYNLLVGSDLEKDLISDYQKHIFIHCCMCVEYIVSNNKVAH